jgi:predicted nucleic acid-binding protein
LVAAHSGTFYDSLYLALAVREDLKVLTADDRMTTAFAKLGRTVRLGDFKPA